MIGRRESDNSRRTQCFFFVFIVLFFTSSFSNAVGLIPVYVSLPVWIGICIWAIYHNRNVQRRTMITFFVLTIQYFLSSIIVGTDFFRMIKFLLPLIAVTLLINTYSLMEIKRAYVNCMVMLAGISLFMFALMISPPTAFSRFIQPTNTFRVYYNFYLFVHCLGSFRNCGMFWEPGAFAPFLLFALAIIAIEKDDEIKSHHVLKMILLLIALITTFSTTGYIALILCLAIIAFNQGGYGANRVGNVLLAIAVVGFGLYFFSDNIFSVGGNNTFGKLYKIFTDENYLNADNLNSSTVRLYSVIKPLEISLEHPLFGVGYAKLQEMTQSYTKGAITCTFSNWFGMYGIPYGCLMLAGYIRFAKSNGTSFLNRILLFALLMVCIVSEDFSNNAFFTGIAILGLIGPSTNSVKEGM